MPTFVAILAQAMARRSAVLVSWFAARAAEIGLINHAVPADELDVRVDAFADKLAAGATKAILWSKMSVNIALKKLAHSMMDASLAYEALSNMSVDHQEAVNAFREKRQPVFKDK